MKTKKMWDESGKDFTKFCNPGDEIDSELYDYFLGICSPAKQHRYYFMMGEPYSVDENNEITFMTFAKSGPYYFFLGVCSINSMKELVKS
jgi:hypothetical protein